MRPAKPDKAFSTKVMVVLDFILYGIWHDNNKVGWIDCL